MILCKICSGDIEKYNIYRTDPEFKPIAGICSKRDCHQLARLQAKEEPDDDITPIQPIVTTHKPFCGDWLLQKKYWNG